MNAPLLCLALLASAPTARAAGPDKAALVEHLRESYNIPPALEVSIEDFKPSDVPGFQVAEVVLSKGRFRQTDKVYLAQDGKHYLLGGFRDLGTNPDQERLSKMDLKAAAVRGGARAPVVVAQYTDFQCPYCQMGYQLMRDKIMKEYPGKVRWVYKALPLSSIHPWAEPAAIAAECAREQGQDKFWSLHDSFFEKQKEINVSNFEEKLKAFAGDAKVDPKRFQACLDGQKSLPAVRRDEAEAEAMDLSSTPTFLVNGHLIRSGADYPAIKQTIEEALKGKHGKP